MYIICKAQNERTGAIATDKDVISPTKVGGNGNKNGSDSDYR